MTPTVIRIELLKRKITMAAIGRSIDVSQLDVQRVIDRVTGSGRIMHVVADTIGCLKKQILPEH